MTLTVFYKRTQRALAYETVFTQVSAHMMQLHFILRCSTKNNSVITFMVSVIVQCLSFPKLINWIISIAVLRSVTFKRLLFIEDTRSRMSWCLSSKRSDPSCSPLPYSLPSRDGSDSFLILDSLVFISMSQCIPVHCNSKCQMKCSSRLKGLRKSAS